MSLRAKLSGANVAQALSELRYALFKKYCSLKLLKPLRP
jgi:hypothetical protein